MAGNFCFFACKKLFEMIRLYCLEISILCHSRQRKGMCDDRVAHTFLFVEVKLVVGRGADQEHIFCWEMIQ